jgi:hypothetical protein
MEAYRIERFGSVDGIVLRSSEDPRPGLKEVLMRIRASSLNFRDLMVLKGGGRGPTTASARSQRSAKELLGSKLATGLPVAFIHAGLAGRSSPTSVIASACCGQGDSPTGNLCSRPCAAARLDLNNFQ